MNITLIEQLVTVRKRKKISTTELAKKLGISRVYLWRFEAGKAQPRLDMLEKWVKEIGLTLELKEEHA